MKLLVLSSGFIQSSVSSDANHVYELAKHLQDRSFRITLLVPHKEGLLLKQNISGLNVERFVYFYPYSLQKIAYGDGIPYNINRSTLAKLEIPAFFLSELFKSLIILKKEKIDALYSHWLIPQGFIGAIIQRTFKIPHIAIIHSSEVTLLKKMPLGRVITKFTLNNSAAIISVSRHRFEELLDFVQYRNNAQIRNKTNFISMGVNLHSINSKDINMDELKYIYNIKSKWIFLFVGRLVEVKGVEYLIDAFEKIYKEYNECQLIVVGSGELESSLKQKVHSLNLTDKIIFTGKLPHSTVLELNQIADIVIFPSIVDTGGFQEGFPKVLIEAVGAGKAIVASKTNGVMEIITDEYNGLLADEKNPDQMAKQVIRIINSPVLKKMLESNAKLTGLQYDWDIISDKITGIIERVVRQ